MDQATNGIRRASQRQRVTVWVPERPPKKLEEHEPPPRETRTGIFSFSPHETVFINATVILAAAPHSSTSRPADFAGWRATRQACLARPRDPRRGQRLGRSCGCGAACARGPPRYTAARAACRAPSGRSRGRQKRWARRIAARAARAARPRRADRG